MSFFKQFSKEELIDAAQLIAASLAVTILMWVVIITLSVKLIKFLV